MPSTRSIGAHAETAALEYLERQGLRLVTRNFACRTGEIDLIMRDGNTLCFVEVRFRRSTQHASGADSITAAKIRKLIRTAAVYLHTHSQTESEYRFDVVSVGVPFDQPEEFSIDWITGAFTAEGY